MNFYQKLAIVGAHIPYGKVATYGQLALLCGKPHNFRQVGYGLNRGLCGRNFPAHRVVNAQGILSGASSFETADMQRILLEAEGVEVKNNQVDLNIYGWSNTLDDALLFTRLFESEGEAE